MRHSGEGTACITSHQRTIVHGRGHIGKMFSRARRPGTMLIPDLVTAVIGSVWLCIARVSCLYFLLLCAPVGGFFCPVCGFPLLYFCLPGLQGLKGTFPKAWAGQSGAHDQPGAMPKGGGQMQLRWAAQLQAPRVQPDPNPQRLLSITGLLRPFLWALPCRLSQSLPFHTPISLSADLPVFHHSSFFLSPVEGRLVLSVSSPPARPLHVASLPLAVLSLWLASLLPRPCPCDMNPPPSHDHSRRRSWGSSGGSAYAGECQASALS